MRSPVHDSAWLLGDDRRTVFLGDQVYNHMHAYLADGFHAEWLDNIDRLRSDFPADATFYVGHGEPTSPALFDWQQRYVESFVAAVAAADLSHHHHQLRAPRHTRSLAAIDFQPPPAARWRVLRRARLST